MQRFILILFVFQLLVFQASAFQQTVQPIKNISQEDGLLSRTVNAIEQDAAGYMWFGTSVGLTRYDGYRFKNYTVSEGLPSNEVTDLKYDTQGRLWVMTEGELCYLLNGDFDYEDRPLPGQEKDAQITSFITTKNGQLWFTAKGKLIALDSTLNEIIWTSDNTPHIPFNNPIIQCEDGNGAIWVYDDDNYMWRIQGDEVVLVPLTFSLPSNKFIRAACIGDDIYYANQNNLIRLKQDKAFIQKTPKEHINYLYGVQEEITPFPDGKSIRSKLPFLIKDSDDRIWTAEADGSFIIVEDKSQSNPPTLPKGIIALDMHKDAMNNIWFATKENGVYFLNASTYSPASSIRLFLNEKSVESICSSEGYTFAIVDGDLYRFYENQDSFYLEKDVPSGINSITALETGDILLSYKDKILRYNEENQDTYDIQNVSTMLAWGDTLFYGTKGKLFRAALPNISKSDRIINRNITAIFKDKKGHLWIGTENGLCKNTGGDGHIEYKDEVDIIFGHNISGIAQTDDGTIWIATKGAGVVGLRDTSSIIINTENYLGHDYCTGLVAEGNAVWVSTITGIHKISNIDFKDEQFFVSYLSDEDILQLSNIQSIAVNDTHVLVGTQEGLIQVHKQYFSDMYDPSKVIITDAFQADKTSLPTDGPIELSHKNNSIRIYYAAINHAQRNNISYTFRMNRSGSEETWKKTRDHFTPTYVLQPGSYVFEVQALSGIWTGPSKVKNLHINVSKPFTQTTGFRLLMVLLGAVILISLYRIYDDGRQKTRLKEVVAQKTADLKENVNELERTNHELEEFNYVVAHDLKAPLRSMYSFSQLLKRTDGENLSDSGKDYVDFIQQSAERLQETIEDLLSFSSIDKTDNNEVEVDLNEILDNALDYLQGIIEVQNVQIQRDDLPTLLANPAHMLQVFQNLITNGIKYQPKDNQPIINIECVQKGNEWLFAVKDNGIGIDKQYEDKVFRIFQRLHSAEEYSGTGIGLPIVKKIIESNGGKIWFESELGMGTTFFFTLPK